MRCGARLFQKSVHQSITDQARDCAAIENLFDGGEHRIVDLLGVRNIQSAGSREPTHRHEAKGLLQRLGQEESALPVGKLAQQKWRTSPLHAQSGHHLALSGKA